MFQELQDAQRELREALEHQTATAEVLGIISRSPTDVQPVLDAIVESAARVCGIDDVVLRLREGNTMVPRAHFGSDTHRAARDQCRMSHHTIAGCASMARSTFPTSARRTSFQMVGSVGSCAHLSVLVPLRQQGELIGILIARRTEVRPFTPAQIKLLETFADQAVIAIENVRLFQELKESLEQQTATSEILGVIASSPTDIQPVLDAVAENAARLCDANDAQIYPCRRRCPAACSHITDRSRVDVSESRAYQPRLTVPAELFIDRQTIHVHDLAAGARNRVSRKRRHFSERLGHRTVLGTPLLREGVADWGDSAFAARRCGLSPTSRSNCLKPLPTKPSSPSRTCGLFKELQERNAELREALEHQTATAEVLGIISRSPTDVQPVLDAIVESAARVCGIDDVVLRLREGNVMVSRAHFGSIPIRPRRDQY